MATLVNPNLIDQVKQSDAFNAAACMNCGICTAICPMGIEHLPRELFRYVLLGLEEDLLAHRDAVYSCLLCRLCEVNCPAEVHIAGNVRTLRHYLNQAVFHVKRMPQSRKGKPTKEVSAR